MRNVRAPDGQMNSPSADVVFFSQRMNPSNRDLKYIVFVPVTPSKFILKALAHKKKKATAAVI